MDPCLTPPGNHARFPRNDEGRKIDAGHYVPPILHRMVEQQRRGVLPGKFEVLSQNPLVDICRQLIAQHVLNHPRGKSDGIWGDKSITGFNECCPRKNITCVCGSLL